MLVVVLTTIYFTSQERTQDEIVEPEIYTSHHHKGATVADTLTPTNPLTVPNNEDITIFAEPDIIVTIIGNEIHITSKQ